MNRLIHILSVICISCSPLTGEETTRNAVVQLHELILPEFRLEKVTLHQGLAVIKTAWATAHPEKSFPVVLLEGQEGFAESALRSSWDLKNIPALTAVTYLAEAYGMTVRHGLDLIVLRPVLALDENAWKTVMLQPSKEVMAFLGLPAQKDGDKEFNSSLKTKFEGYGLQFEPGFEVAWFGSQLYIRNTPEEISKIKGLFMLIDAGYTPTKSK